MPISKYFKGKGQDVMRSMEKQYGPEKAKSVFYATSNKQGMNPRGDAPVGNKAGKLKKIKKVKRLGTIRTR